MSDAGLASDMSPHDSIITRMGVNIRISDIAVAGKDDFSGDNIVPSVLTLSIEGDEVARLDLTENTEKAMTWVADGELELPADLEAIEFSLLREGAPAEVPTVVGTVLLTGHDLLVNGLDGITELFGKGTFDVPDSSYKLGWDCVPFCEEAVVPEDATPAELRELDVLARRVASLRDWLYKRYLQSGDVADIDKAIKAAETVCCLGSKQEHVFPFSAHNLGVMCTTRYQDFGDINTLERGISALERARAIFPDTPDQVSLLVTLASAYAKHYDHGQGNASLEKSLQAATQAIPLALKYDSLYISAAYFAQASVYERQYERSRDATLLDLALKACEKALDLVHDTGPSKARYQDRLGWLKHQQFVNTNEIQYLQEAITLGQLAVNATVNDLHSAAYLHNLANSYHTHWQYSNDIASLKQAMLAQRKAVALTPDNSEHKYQYWDTLGTLLVSQWHITWDQHDISDAVHAHEEAIKLIPQDHGNRAQYLINLANSYGCMFTQTGDILHLEHAISTLHEANDLVNASHTMKSTVSNSMANIYLSQFGLLHQPEDIEKAISGYKEAVQLLGAANFETPIYMQQLAYALRMKYSNTYEYTDIREAVSVLEQAHNLMANDHPRKPELLIDLGTAYQMQADFFGVGNNIPMIDKAIEVHTSALEMAPEESHLIALAHSYMARFQGSHQPEDINRAIELAEATWNKTSDTNPYKVLCYEVIGNAYGVRYEHCKDLEDLRRAVRNHEQVAKLAVHQPDRRLESALKWARMSMEDSLLLQSALEAYDYAISLIPQVVWQGLPLSKRYDRIKVIGDLANEAVTVALASREYGKALEWLERARSVLWGQLLRVRTPAETLMRIDPALGAEYKNLSQQLQAVTATQSISVERAPKLDVAQRHMQLAREWELLVERIQAVPGLEHFLQPQPLTELMKASQRGIIVVIAIYHHECHALAITPELSEPKHIPLPHFSLEKAEDMQKDLKEILDMAGRVARDASRKATLVSKQESGTSLQDILSELWHSVAKPILTSLHLATNAGETEELRQLWWCLTGPMAFLPMHAAGSYSDKRTGHKVSDFVVSSYIPTINSLLEARASKKGKFNGLLTVSQPDTPGLRILPNTKQEIVRIQAVASEATLRPITALEHSRATMEAVVKGMEIHSWVHLACHAIQDTLNPLDSAFYLYDGKVELSRITEKTLPHADFAFLSACQTATGDENLPEESMHLAAGMLVAGYSSVIATMWSIMDEDAPIIAEEVYKYMLSDGVPDSGRAAYALHHAIKAFRQQRGDLEKSLLSWVPFIHVGL